MATRRTLRELYRMRSISCPSPPLASFAMSPPQKRNWSGVHHKRTKIRIKGLFGKRHWVYARDKDTFEEKIQLMKTQQREEKAVDAEQVYVETVAKLLQEEFHAKPWGDRGRFTSCCPSAASGVLVAPSRSAATTPSSSDGARRTESLEDGHRTDDDAAVDERSKEEDDYTQAIESSRAYEDAFIHMNNTMAGKFMFEELPVNLKEAIVGKMKRLGLTPRLHHD